MASESQVPWEHIKVSDQNGQQVKYIVKFLELIRRAAIPSLYKQRPAPQ